MLPAATNPYVATSALNSLASLAAAIGSNPHIVGAAWFASSALFTTYSTHKYLKYEPPSSTNDLRKDPLIASRSMKLAPADQLTIWRFFGSLCIGLVLSSNFDVLGRIQKMLQVSSSFALPGIFLFVANLSNAIALERIGISLTYTTKCGIPLITVLVTAIMDGAGALPSRTALLSLLPIAVGIAGASWSSPAFETIGFLAALVSTTSQSCLNVFSKRAILATGVSGPAAQRCMVATGLGIALLYNSLFWRRTDAEVAAPARPAWLTTSAVLAYHIEYVLSFSFVRLVQPVTYGCIDAMRRLATILSGRYMFGSETPLTPINIVGIALALLGALGYSIASTTIPK